MTKEDKGRVRITVIHFETESDNATLQENIRTIAGTLTRALGNPQRAMGQPAQLTALNNSDQAAGQEVIEADSTDEDIPLTNSSPKKQAKLRQTRTPQLVDFDLTGGTMPLKTFLDEKKPDSDVKKYLAITFWFKKYHKVGAVTMDHTHTGYRHMGWHVPKDAGAPFRQMKSARYGWVGSGSAAGSYTINHIGENMIQGMGNPKSK